MSPSISDSNTSTTSKRKAKTGPVADTRYKVLNRHISYPPRMIAERIIVGGEHDIPWEEQHQQHHYEGEVVDDIPVLCVPGLLEVNAIEEVK